jgi:dUTP pyrophosphatase
MRIRGFEIITAFQDAKLTLPARKTERSAGYDLAAAETVTVAPGEMRVISTGLKAYMQDDEFVGIHLRSSLAIKYELMLANSQGIIDADYYDNPDNEGHILLGIWNRGCSPFLVEKGMRIAQAVFYKFLIADNDPGGRFGARQGGIGSTGL